MDTNRIIKTIGDACKKLNALEDNLYTRILHVNPKLYDDMVDSFKAEIQIKEYPTIPMYRFYGIEFRKCNLLEYDSIMESVLFNGKIIDVKLYRLFKNEENER
jgi:hypothetical protein